MEAPHCRDHLAISTTRKYQQRCRPLLAARVPTAKLRTDLNMPGVKKTCGFSGLMSFNGIIVMVCIHIYIYMQSLSTQLAHGGINKHIIQYYTYQIMEYAHIYHQ